MRLLVCVGLGCVRVHREIVVPAQTGSGGSITEEGGRAYHHRLLAQEELCTRRAEEKGETSPPLSCNFLFLQLSFGSVGKELIDEVTSMSSRVAAGSGPASRTCFHEVALQREEFIPLRKFLPRASANPANHGKGAVHKVGAIAV
jgi:hypothetical protein